MRNRVIVITQTKNRQICGSSTGELVSEGIDRGFEIWVADPVDVSKRVGFPVEAVCNCVNSIARATPVTKHYCEFGKNQNCYIKDFDILLMRVQPPMDNAYHALCGLLLELPKEILKINDPKGILTIQEKLMPLEFADIHPLTLVSQNYQQIIDFIKETKDAVVKPLNEYQGNGVIKVTVENASEVISSLVEFQNMPLVIQKFIPDVYLGDKRVFLLDGLPIAAINRIPQKGNFIASLHKGSSYELVDITKRDCFIAEKIAPKLKENGLVFVGLDIISGFLTEIGTTSPTGMVQHRTLAGWSIAEKVWDWICDGHDRVMPRACH